jgi:hypothetical protein
LGGKKFQIFDAGKLGFFFLNPRCLLVVVYFFGAKLKSEN